MYKCFVNLKDKNFTNIGYRTQGTDSHLKKIHGHEGFEILQIWSSNGTVLIGESIYPMVEGAIYLINGIEAHSTNPVDETSYTRSKITFSPSYIRTVSEILDIPHILDLFFSLDTSSTYKMINPCDDIKNIIDRTFQSIYYEDLKGEWGASQSVISQIINLLIIINRCLLGDTEKKIYTISSQKHISSIIKYINENLFTDIDLDKLCNSLHLSKYYTCHLFKKITGMTIMQYINERRVSESKKLLLSTQNSISDISSTVGFSNFSVFCKVFKRLTGFTPRDFRKQFYNYDS